MLTIVGACVVCTVYRDACSLVSAVEYYCALGPAIRKEHILLSCGSCVEVHAAVVLVVYTVYRSTLLGSNRVYIECNALVDPTCGYKHIALSCADCVYMFTGLTIHTICRNGLSCITFVDNPGYVSVVLLCGILRNFTGNLNTRVNALEGTLDVLGNIDTVTSLCGCIEADRLILSCDSGKNGSKSVLSVCGCTEVEMCKACAKIRRCNLVLEIGVLASRVNFRIIECYNASDMILSDLRNGQLVG